MFIFTTKDRDILMTWQTILYFSSVLLTCALTGFLAWYAWRQLPLPGVRAYALLALSECLMALTDIISMVSRTQAQALFWFNLRFLFTAIIPVIFLAFALAYNGQKGWLSKKLLAGALTIPVITQIMLWSNSLHGLWVKHEVTFHQNGPVWIVDTSTRIPGLWFLVHSFYSQILMLAGIVLIFLTAWRMWRKYRGQALLLIAGALVGLTASLIPSFNLLPQIKFNPFIPGIGISALLYALAIFRFHFLKHVPAEEGGMHTAGLHAQENRSLAIFVLIFILFASGIVAIGYLSYQNYEREFRVQVEAQLSAIAELKRNGLQEWRAELLAVAGMLYQNSAFTERVEKYLETPSDAQAQTQLKAWLDKLQTNGQYDRVFLLDTAGVERISSPATPEPVAAHLAQEAAALLDSGQVTFLDFYRDSPDGKIHLALLVPIYAKQDPGHPLGLLVLRIDPNVYLYPYLNQWPIPSATAETLLVRRNGDEVLYLNELRFGPVAALNLHFPLTDTTLPAVKAALGQTGIVEGADYRGISVVADVRPVPDSPWFLVSKMSTTEVYAPLRARLWLMVLFFGMLIAAAGAGLMLVWRQQGVRYYRAQVETAESLRKSQEQYRGLIEHASDGIFIADSSRKYVEVNPSGCAMLGYSRDEILSKQISDLIAPDDMVTARTILGEWQQGKTMLTEWRLICKDGSLLPVEISGRMLSDGRFQSIIRDITERKQTEEKMLVSETRYRRLFEAARDGILILDAETGMIVDVNPFMIELLGFSREVFFGKKIWELGFFKDIAANKAKFKKLLQKEYIRYENLPLETALGRRINVEFVSNVYQVDHHKVIQCNIRDITERKQAEDAKQRSELLIRTLYELSPDSIMLIDPNDPNITWPIIDCNATACLMNGYLRDELIGHSIDIVNVDPYIPTEKTAYLEKLREAGNLKYEVLHRHKNGTIFPVEISTTIIKVGERELVIGIDRDITERVQAEKKLAWEQYLLGAMLDTLPDHIYFKDRQSRFTRISKSLAETLGSGDPAKLLGKTDFDFFTEEHARQAFEVEQNIIATGQPVIGLEEKETWPDGRVTWVDTIKMPLLDPAGNIIGTFGSSRNITERKQAEEQIANYTEHLEEIVDERTRELRQAQEKLVRQERLATLGQLAGSIGHELRNPLGVISNAVYFLKMSQPDANDTILEYLDIIENETRTSDKIVTDLLDFTRIKSVDREPAEVSKLVRQTLERYPVPRSVKVALKIPADLPPILADPRQVVQVLGNLVTNAFQAMQGGGKLTLSASVEGAMMVIVVQDTGTGISTENMGKLFEPLFTTKIKGIGLGLAVSRKLAEANSGRIEVQSTPGKGSTFTVYLPVYEGVPVPTQEK